jgi:hypothetical protein
MNMIVMFIIIFDLGDIFNNFWIIEIYVFDFAMFDEKKNQFFG